jgi:quercetin dioxygenase-like cupin family protein
MRYAFFLPIFNLILNSFLVAQGQGTVEKKYSDSKIKFEHIISGHLAELNGKYKFRVTETTYAPGGFIGKHQHAGPGIRYIVSGQLTYVQQDTAKIFNTGDYFFEPGDITHNAYNNAKEPVVIMNFDILPIDWTGPTVIMPPFDKK